MAPHTHDHSTSDGHGHGAGHDHTHAHSNGLSKSTRLMIIIGISFSFFIAEISGISPLSNCKSRDKAVVLLAAGARQFADFGCCSWLLHAFIGSGS